MHPLNKRIEATKKTLAKFEGKFYELGSCDCIHLARSQMVNMGHNVPKIPNYSTPIAALRRLKKLGHDSLEGLLSEHCFEISPASMLVGDLATVRGSNDDGISAIVIYAGSKFLGFPAETGKFEVVSLTPERAFRVADC